MFVNEIMKTCMPCFGYPPLLMMSARYVDWSFLSSKNEKMSTNDLVVNWSPAGGELNP